MLFDVQRIRENAKQLQILGLMKEMFDCGGNTRKQMVSVRHHERNSLGPRKDDFLKLMMRSSQLFFQEMQDRNKLYCIFLMAHTMAVSVFRNSALGRESNLHAILIHMPFLVLKSCRKSMEQIREYTVITWEKKIILNLKGLHNWLK
jgi:hypothetical protein